MQFKHPELLYALFLLLIPIFIHLFQLRKFQKIAFTNVAFLKKVTIETRKSSQLKKWITLFLRLLALACIVLAFAQPFTAATTALNTKKEFVVYLDNSFSMQAKGSNGPLLQRTIQQLYDRSSAMDQLHWITNTQTFSDVSLDEFKTGLLDVPYTPHQLSLQEVLLKAGQLFSDDPASDKKLLVVSDFQSRVPFVEIPSEFTVEAVQLKPVTQNNISIDTAYIDSKNSAQIQLKVVVSAIGQTDVSVPVSLFNDNILVAKTAADLSEENPATVAFDIDAESVFKGRLTIDDANLLYDNSLYFSINTPKKIKVLAISEANDDFIERIFNTNEFAYTAQPLAQADYNIFADQNFIILNELNEIPNALGTAVNDFVDKGGSVFMIPSSSAQVASYNSLLGQLNLGNLNPLVSREKKVTQIIFSHPLYKDVFEKQVVNFQYPKVNSYFPLNANASAALRFEDGTPFLVVNGSVSLATAAFNTANSNFKSSPLIVPSLYNMAQQSLPIAKLYYHTGVTNNYAVPVTLMQDEILTLRDSTSSFVPLQQTKANKVMVTTVDEPSNAGVYSINRKEQYIEDISYNYARDESDLYYLDIEDWDGVRSYGSVQDVFETLQQENSITGFWKWFAIFAILFLVFEMLVLKFYKQ